MCRCGNKFVVNKTNALDNTFLVRGPRVLPLACSQGFVGRAIGPLLFGHQDYRRDTVL